jgi:FkbM family methyltransferase
MIASPRNAEARSIFTHGFSEYALAHLLGKMIGRDWICVDVGANQGEYTILTAQHATGGQVYAFEPVELIYDRLQANIRLNGLTNVTVTRSAVHRYDGTCSFYINRNPRRIGLSSLSPTDYFADAGMEEHTVPCVTLDSALSARQRVDLMKIDVEGHELDVLEGARSTLERCVPIIAFEFFTASRPYSTEAANYLVARNYNLYRVDYDPSHGAGLVPVTDLRLEALSSVHSPFEPINLVAVHPQKSDMVAELAKPPYSQRKDK